MLQKQEFLREHTKNLALVLGEFFILKFRPVMNGNKDLLRSIINEDYNENDIPNAIKLLVFT